MRLGRRPIPGDPRFQGGQVQSHAAIDVGGLFNVLRPASGGDHGIRVENPLRRVGGIAIWVV
jgi:hypothetical protein